MDSSNLSVILAPNLLHSGDGTEKMNANTEKRLKLQAAVVQCFIENAHSFGMTCGADLKSISSVCQLSLFCFTSKYLTVCALKVCYQSFFKTKFLP